MENFKTSADVLFILLGAIMILAMHAGFAFLELGTVRKKNQVNALVKILTDFAISTLPGSGVTKLNPSAPMEAWGISLRALSRRSA